METDINQLPAQPVKRNFAIIMIPLLLVSLIINLFLFYQNQQLKLLSTEKEVVEIPSVAEESYPAPTIQTVDHLRAPFTYNPPTGFILNDSDPDNIMMSNDSISIDLKYVDNADNLAADIAPILDQIAANDLGASQSQVETHNAYTTQMMSAEGIFSRYTYLDMGDSYLHLETSADTRLPGNEEPAIYQTVGSFHDQLLSSFNFL